MTSSADLRNPLIAPPPREVIPSPTPSIAQPPAPRTSVDPGTRPPGLDIERLAANTARFIEQSGKALAAYLKPFEAGKVREDDVSDTLAVAVSSIGKVVEHWTSDPQRLVEAQAAIAQPFLQLWSQTYRRLSGEAVEPVVPVTKGDKRYSAPEWHDMPLYDFLRQAHAISATWAEGLVERSEGVEPRTRAKARFYLRQITSALSPANFLATNPELMRQTFATSGDNLARGAALLAEDMEAGGGRLRIRQTDASKFALGVNVAVTPGKVVFRNDLFELIQYAPATDTVLKRPLLVVPPWINKYYILDLNPQKSFVRWAVGQGLTVFMMSWVNPDGRHREKGFESYMREGVFAALGAVRAATGEGDVNALGYCIGGTLLATALATMAKTHDQRVRSATFFTAQADFTDAGEIQVFIDEEQLKVLEAKMEDAGYLEGSSMAMAFNMLRPTDLVWSYVVNNYVKGEPPAAFDLLYWNSDATRLPARNHSDYLRNFYIGNKLAKGELTMGGEPLSLGDVTVPSYFVAAKEDHIAPAASVYRGAKLFGGPVRYVLGASGHIAGVINPPGKAKYGYATGPKPFGELVDWLPLATTTPGSWWGDWFDWLSGQAPHMVPARVPGDGKLPILADAPGDYVRVKG